METISQTESIHKAETSCNKSKSKSKSNTIDLTAFRTTHNAETTHKDAPELKTKTKNVKKKKSKTNDLKELKTISTSEKKREAKWHDIINTYRVAQGTLALNLGVEIRNLFYWIDDYYGTKNRKKYWDSRHSDGKLKFSYCQACKYAKIGNNAVDIIKKARKDGIDEKLTFKKCMGYLNREKKDEDEAIEKILKRKLKEKDEPPAKKTKISKEEIHTGLSDDINALSIGGTRADTDDDANDGDYDQNDDANDGDYDQNDDNDDKDDKDDINFVANLKGIFTKLFNINGVKNLILDNYNIGEADEQQQIDNVIAILLDKKIKKRNGK